MTSPATLVAQVRLPDVVLPAGDTVAVRRRGAVLSAAGTALSQVAWRLRADGAAMSAARRWCGVASAAYHRAAADHCEHLATAGRALQVAGQACLEYAHSLDQAQGRASDALQRARHLVRERDDLAAACRRYESDRARALFDLSSPVQVGELFSGARVADAELHRLQEWADEITAAASRVTAQAQAADHVARTAADAASQVFEALATLTRAARADAARVRHESLVAAGILPAEDGSAGSRLAGLLDALRDDVTGPLETVGGLLGAGGHAGESWSRLGQGIGRAATHPGELVDALLDTKDAGQGDWGHWVGTVVPGALLSAGSGGAYSVARAVRSAALVASSARLAEQLRRAQELVDLADAARFRFANGGLTASRLIPGGGLIWHEAAGGHSLDRHVGLEPAQLRRRVAEYRLAAASSFSDRHAAEQLVAEAMDRQAASIATWLGTDQPETSLLTEMRRVVGTTVRRGSRFVHEGTRIKLVLVREPQSPVGYILLTAFPLP